jgi:uncharacterized membrane protein (DUF373 family)
MTVKTAVERFQQAIAGTVIVLAMLATAAATIRLGWTFVRDLFSPPFGLLTVGELQELFGQFLIVLIGLELLETIEHIVVEKRVHVESILLLAMIAMARKVIVLEVRNVPPAAMLSVAAVFVGLAAGYYTIGRIGQRGM